MMLLIDWFKANQLSLNIGKTVLVKFWSEGKSFNLDVNTIMLTNVKSTKFLDISIDENLSWDEHAQCLRTKLTANRYLLAMSKNLLNQYSL